MVNVWGVFGRMVCPNFGRESGRTKDDRKMSSVKTRKLKPRVTAALILLAGIVFVAGCASSTVPRRGRVRAGMTLAEVYDLYKKIDPMDSETSRYIPQMQPVSTQEEGDCIFGTYRFWLCEDAELAAYLLSFKSCKLTEQARQVIRDRAYERTLKLANRRNVDPEDMPGLFALVEASIPEYSREELVEIEPEK